MRVSGLRKVLIGSVVLGASHLLALPAGAATGVVAQTSVPILNNFLAILANPDVAYFLLVIGLLGLVAEVVVPGVGLPGVLGAICLILALVGLGQLPTNWGGVALIAAAVVMFIVDLKFTGIGLSIGALVAFALGSLLLFTPFWVAPSEETAIRLNPWLVLLTTGAVAAFFFLGVSAAVKAQKAPIAVGRETMIGRTGIARQTLDPTGIVHVGGEEWSAVSAGGTPIRADTPVRVVAVEGLTLRVMPIDAAPSEIPSGPA